MLTTYRGVDGDSLTNEFTEEMDELHVWLDETENIIGSTLHPLDEQALADLLEKVKVGNLLHRLKLKKR